MDSGGAALAPPLERIRSAPALAQRIVAAAGAVAVPTRLPPRRHRLVGCDGRGRRRRQDWPRAAGAFGPLSVAGAGGRAQGGGGARGARRVGGAAPGARAHAAALEGGSERRGRRHAARDGIAGHDPRRRRTVLLGI